MKLPGGVLYVGLDEDLSPRREIARKGKTLFSDDGRAIDWFMKELTIVDCTSYHDGPLTEGVSYMLERHECRDGCFDVTDMFLVFEKYDMLQLRQVIDESLSGMK